MKSEITIIVDGWLGKHRRWEPLRRKLEHHVGSASIWRYRNHGGVPLDILGKELATHLHSLKQPFHLIGFSMGGLVIREAMRQDASLPLRRAVFLNVPHAGSLLAHCLPLPALRQMRSKSPFLAALGSAPWPYPTFTGWCPGDLMVLPARSACWPPDGKMHRCNVPAHTWPVFSLAIHRAIASFLQKSHSHEPSLA